MIHEHYYSRLCEKCKKVYIKMLNAISKKEKNVSFTNISGQEFLNTVFAVKMDHPEIFYVNFTSTKYSPSIFGINYQIQYFWSNTEQQENIEKFEKQISKIIKIIENKPSLYEKLLSIHDYFIKNIKYDSQAVLQPSKHLHAFNVFGVFKNKEAVCEGISKAYKLLCDRLNISCLIITGESSLEQISSNLSHAWNIVKTEVGYVHIDMTWDIALSKSSDFKRFDYFCLCDNDISSDHKYEKICECPSDKYSYFNVFKRQISGINSLNAYIEQALSEGNDIYFKLSKTADTNDELIEKIQNYIPQKIRKVHKNGFKLKLVMNFEQLIFFYKILDN